MERNVRDGKIRIRVPLPLSSIPSLVQRVRRRGFCLLDRLMRQGSRSKGWGQQGGHGRASILINPVQIHRFNKLNQGAVCLFSVCVGPCTCMQVSCLLLYLFPSVWERERQRWRFAHTNQSGVTDETGSVEGNTHWWILHIKVSVA